MASSSDVTVLGAGIVGVCVALHLQKRGRSVVLMDRREPGLETSFGNAGLIQRDGFYPFGFPRDVPTLLRYARNQSTDMHYHPLAMPGLAPFLFKYWRNSTKSSLRRIADSSMKLIEACVSEHDTLIEEAGAQELIGRNGWLRLYRSPAGLTAAIKDATFLKQEFGNEFFELDGRRVAELEPDLRRELEGGILWPATVSVRDPGGLVRAYADLFTRRGGRIERGDAQSLEAGRDDWSVRTDGGVQRSGQVVLALGPWTGELGARFGHRIPMVGKRGYHMHYRFSEGAKLNRPVSDVEGKYMVAPMVRGLRLTTGVEFARLAAKATPVQLKRIEQKAREIFPMENEVDSHPWLGARDCTSDLLPIVGPSTQHKGLWFCAGHAHNGLTYAPVTGRLIAEMMCGESPFTDPAPYRPDRF